MRGGPAGSAIAPRWWWRRTSGEPEPQTGGLALLTRPPLRSVGAQGHLPRSGPSTTRASRPTMGGPPAPSLPSEPASRRGTVHADLKLTNLAPPSRRRRGRERVGPSQGLRLRPPLRPLPAPLLPRPPERARDALPPSLRSPRPHGSSRKPESTNRPLKNLPNRECLAPQRLLLLPHLPRTDASEFTPPLRPHAIAGVLLP